MKNHGICTILTHVIENVLPQPLSHNIAICMDQKHTKSTCSNQIYHFTVSYIQVLEKHKRAKSSNQSHNMITISHKPKHRYILLTKTVDNHAMNTTLAIEINIDNKVNHPQFLLDIFIGNL